MLVKFQIQKCDKPAVGFGAFNLVAAARFKTKNGTTLLKLGRLSYRNNANNFESYNNLLVASIQIPDWK